MSLKSSSTELPVSEKFSPFSGADGYLQPERLASPATQSQQSAQGAHQTEEKAQSDLVFGRVAELFSVLSTPIRLKIISAVCEREKNVTQLLAEIDTTQPNMSQHLAMLYRAGVLAKRRDSTQVYYKVQDQRVAELCRTVTVQVASDLDH